MSGYEFKKTLKKFGLIAAEIFVAGVIVYLTENGVYMFLVPVFEALRNYLKHHKDE